GECGYAPPCHARIGGAGRRRSPGYVARRGAAARGPTGRDAGRTGEWKAAAPSPESTHLYSRHLASRRRVSDAARAAPPAEGTSAGPLPTRATRRLESALFSACLGAPLRTETRGAPRGRPALAFFGTPAPLW